jgi:16S rRNA G1207 methylase RsmC
MALEFDGFEAWRAIAESPDGFASLRADAAKSARAALVKYVKAKTTGLAELRRARKALGKQTFALLIDGMKDSEVKSLAARLDKHRPELKTAAAAWRRQHILQLVKADIEPAGKSDKPAKKTKAPRKPKQDEQQSEKDGGWFASAGAIRKR